MRPFVPASLYATIVDHVHIGIFVLDLYDRVVLWNRFMARHTGRKAEEVIGKNLFEEFPELPRDWLRQKLNQAAERMAPLSIGWQERPYLFRFPRAKTGSRSPDHMRQDCSLIPIDGGAGRPDAICICVTDVTEVSLYQALLEQTNVLLQHDLELTGAVQSLVLPKADRCSLPNLQLTGVFRPAIHCGGDWWWYDVRQNGSVLVFVGDVLGHGAPSAMVTMAIESTFQTLKELQPKLAVSRIFEAMNTCLQRLGQYYMTMAVVEIPKGRGNAKWWSAAAPPIFLMNEAGRVSTIGTGGSMLGGQGPEVDSGAERISPGDRILMFTDGTYEFEWQGGQFGLRRLRDLFASTRPLDLEAAKQQIDQVISSEDRGAQDDDITFVLVDVL